MAEPSVLPESSGEERRFFQAVRHFRSADVISADPSLWSEEELLYFKYGEVLYVLEFVTLSGLFLARNQEGR
tara:strand:+ start:293 stop:508 length:216 start_codon:yes stop_codon:yes gene_type:complete